MGTLLTQYAPFDSGPGANVTEATWRSMMRRNVVTGVIAGVLNEFLVIGDSSGMLVKIATGECWIEGHWGQLAAGPVNQTVTTAHATLPRLDRVILRCDFGLNKIEYDILTGTANASPVVPTLTQNTSIWEISLAVVAVAAAASTITAGNVTDQRTWGIAHARRIATASATITVGTAGLKIPFGTVDYNSDDVTFNTAGDIATLNRAGVWAIDAGVRWTSASTGWRILHISDSTDTNIYKSDTFAYPATVTVDQGLNASRRFPLGQTISLWGFVDAGTTTLNTASPLNKRTNISLTWVGP